MCSWNLEVLGGHYVDAARAAFRFGFATDYGGRLIGTGFPVWDRVKRAGFPVWDGLALLGRHVARHRVYE